MTMRRALARGRRRHLALMIDTCEITRSGGAQVWDPVTGSYTTPPPGQVYAGACRVKPWAAGEDTQAAEHQIALRRYWVELPWDAPEQVEVGDVVTVTSSTDAWLVDRPLVVTPIELATARTARWLTVEDQRV